MDEATENLLGAVPFRITNPERIPVQRYYDEEFFKLECDRLWTRAWQMACRLEEIPQVGDWVEYQIVGKSVIVVRSKTGVKAFHNACRHRGLQVASARGNCKGAGFVCPFHGWRYNMDGENTFVFGRQLFSEENLEQAELNLMPCRVEEWGGCAFINFDDDAPPLRECFGLTAEKLEVRNVDKMKVDAWYVTELPVNWKLAVEAFQEGYHVMRTHPQLHAVLPPEMHFYGPDMGSSPTAARQQTPRQFVEAAIGMLVEVADGMGGMVTKREAEIATSLRDMELPDDTGGAAQAFYTRLGEEIRADGLARGVPMFDINQVAMTHPVATVEYLFPNYFLLPMLSAMLSYRVRPLTPETCQFEIVALSLHPEDEAREVPVAPASIAPDDPGFPRIPAQDNVNFPLQRRGVHAKGFEYMRLSKDVEGLLSNYQRLIDGYIAGLAPDRLAQASRIACGSLDSPIRDIGF